jgi:hypothetical protein
MFIDDARHLVEGRAAARQPLLEAWQATRLRFLEGGLDAVAMAAAQSALRMADADPALLDQVQEALLSPLDDPGLEARLLALYHELGAAQGDPVALARADRLRAEGEAAWLRTDTGRLARHQALALLARSRLDEEREPAWRALAPAGEGHAARVLELQRIEDEVSRALGYAGPLDRQAQRLGLDVGRAERWLEDVGSALLPAIRDAASRRAVGLAAHRHATAATLPQYHWGHVHPYGTAGRDGQPLAGVDAALSSHDPLDLVQQAGDLLGWETGRWCAAWRRAGQSLPAWLQGPVGGPEGRPPVVFLRPDGVGACRRALGSLGRSLAEQATALRLAEEGETPGGPWLPRALQGAAAQRLLEDLPTLPGVAAGLLENLDSGWEEAWRIQELLELGRTLLTLDWRRNVPRTLEAADQRWVELRLAWYGLATAPGDERCWTRDPWLTLLPDAALGDLAGRLLAAGLRSRWATVAAPGSPEWGGLWLEALTEPDEPELWEAAGDRLLEALDVAALVTDLGGAVGTGLADGPQDPGRGDADGPEADELAGQY